MKKFAVAIVAILAITLTAQAQFRLGVAGGAGLSNQRVNASQGSVYSSNNMEGYHFGLASDVNVAGNFYLQTQLLFSRKGSIHLSTLHEQDTRIRLSYVEVPVNVVYKLDLGFGKVYGGTGATFSYAVGGEQRLGAGTKKLFSKGNDEWRRKDLSLNFTAGLELNNGLFASVTSQKGLLNIHRGPGSIRNESLTVSVGYMIDWSKFRKKG